MPEGQFSGDKAKYLYQSDGGTNYSLLLDTTLADITEVGLAQITTGDVYGQKPTNFKPRVVFWQGTLNGVLKRKALVCAANSTLYNTVIRTELTIDGVAGVITGRRGESLTF